VQVSRVDLDGRKIDFRLVKEGEEFVARAMREKGVPPAASAGKGGTSKASAKKAGRGAPKAAKAAPKKSAAKSKGRTRR
jgi:ribonuclease R